MSTTPVSSEMFAAFASLQGKFAELDPMTGSVERPPEGLHGCIVMDMVVANDGKFRVDDAGQEVPALSVTFRYQLVEDPTRPKPLVFPGKTFTIPPNLAGLPEKKMKQVEMEIRRLKGHIKNILGLSEDPANLVAGLTECMRKIKDPTNAVVVEVRAQYDKVKDRQDPTKTNLYFKEYITKTLSA